MIHSKHYLYQTWASMIQRCENPKRWKGYGERGIKVCLRWRKSFPLFVEDMGDRPQGCSIDRINPNGNYEPGNCRWATPKQQAETKRRPIVRICNTCGTSKLNGRTWHGRCHKCNEYQRRNGFDRPVNFKEIEKIRADKISKIHSRPILQIDKNGSVMAEFKSVREASKALTGRSLATAIGNCLAGRSKSSWGYMWKYKNPVRYITPSG